MQPKPSIFPWVNLLLLLSQTSQVPGKEAKYVCGQGRNRNKSFLLEISMTQLAAAMALSTGSQVPIRRVALRPIIMWFIRFPSVFISCDGTGSFTSVADYIPRRTASDVRLEIFYRNGKRIKNGRQRYFILFQKLKLHACHYCPSWKCIIRFLCALFQGSLHTTMSV